MTLKEIIKKHNLYRGDHWLGTDKEFLHNYVTNYYQQAFEPLQNKEIKLFEIGTCTGASLKMWKEFFVNGKVEGVDINDRRISDFIDDEITYYHANAYAKYFVDSLGQFDIIIDDGPHTIETQLEFISLYYPHLNEGGLMVIEDIDSDHNIQLLKWEAERIFGKPATIIDKRDETNLNNEIILWIQK